MLQCWCFRIPLACPSFQDMSALEKFLAQLTELDALAVFETVLQHVRKDMILQLRKKGTWQFLDLVHFYVTRVPPIKRRRGAFAVLKVPKVHIRGTKRLRMLLR